MEWDVRFDCSGIDWKRLSEMLRKMKTGMALFKSAELMKEKGFTE